MLPMWRDTLQWPWLNLFLPYCVDKNRRLALSSNNGLCLTAMKSNFVACGMVNLGISKCVQAWIKHPDFENMSTEV